ncbi:cobalamin biosynthesis protein [Streptomyces albus]|uniref:cobalamin biosynthesis protein n=1 Tax=Streptomyces albus TaxID=1888 RepID=UPI00099DFE97
MTGPAAGRPGRALAVAEPLLTAGVGARAGVTADEVLALLREALEAAGAVDTAEEGMAGATDAAGAAGRPGPAVDGPGPAVHVLATAEAKAGEAGIAGAAARLGVPLVTYPAAELAAVAVPHPSRTVLGATGTPSVAEAAALLAAGPGAELLVPKSASPRATVAVAHRPAAPGPRATASWTAAARVRPAAPHAGDVQPAADFHATAPHPAGSRATDPHATPPHPVDPGLRPATPHAEPHPSPADPRAAGTEAGPHSKGRTP